MHALARSGNLFGALALLAVAVAPAIASAQPVAPTDDAAAATDDAGATAQAGATDAAPAVPARALVVHVAPSEAVAGHDLRLVAVVDAAWTESALLVRYRPMGGDAFQEAEFERSSAGGYYAAIPAVAVSRPGLEYYIAGRELSGGEIDHFATAETPHPVRVEPTQEARWQEQEHRRLGGRLSTLSVDLIGHDFGNRHDKTDRFLRGEIEWTYRLIQPHLYAIALGYGLIEGETPASEDVHAEVLSKGARLGYGKILLRFHRAVWLETKASIGVDREELVVGLGAKLTLGRPWRSCVDFGAELLENLGPSYWVRLQWDTVPPFLMGASIHKTDLPAASLDGGTFIAYDISYPITQRFLVRGSLSFGSRDGAAHFGGGLGTAFSF